MILEVEEADIDEVVLVLEAVAMVGSKSTVVLPPIDAIPVDTTPVELGTERKGEKKLSARLQARRKITRSQEDEKFDRSDDQTHQK